MDMTLGSWQDGAGQEAPVLQYHMDAKSPNHDLATEQQQNYENS